LTWPAAAAIQQANKPSLTPAHFSRAVFSALPGRRSTSWRRMMTRDAGVCMNSTIKPD